MIQIESEFTSTQEKTFATIVLLDRGPSMSNTQTKNTMLQLQLGFPDLCGLKV